MEEGSEERVASSEKSVQELLVSFKGRLVSEGRDEFDEILCGNVVVVVDELLGIRGIDSLLFGEENGWGKDLEERWIWVLNLVAHFIIINGEKGRIIEESKGE